jgi:hypothetical protein
VILGAVNAVFPEDVVNILSKSATQIGSAAEALTPVLGDLHEVLQPRGIVEVDQPGGPPGNLSTAAARIDTALKNFNDIVGDPEVKANVKESVANFRAVTEDGTALVAEWKDAAVDVRNAVADGRALVGDIQAAVQKADGNLDRLARETTDDLERMGRVLDELYALVRGVNQGEGTVGQLVVDAKLYDTMVLTFRRLAETTEEFRLLVKDWQKGKVKVGL